MRYQSIRNHIFLFIIVMAVHTAFPSILADTLIKTPQGLAAAQNIRVNDRLLGYSANKELTEVVVTKITMTDISTIIVITTNNGIIRAAPDQLFYDPSLQAWITAKNITPSTVLLDSRGNYCSCIDVKHLSITPTQKAYNISTTAPHNFFATNQEILTHNFFPLIAIGISCAFGLGSVEFAGLSIATLIGGTAIGVKLFQKQSKQTPTVTITPQDGGTYGGFNKDPNEDDDNTSTKNRICNTISKTEFFKSVSKDYEHWRDGIYKRKHKAKGFENAEYLEWDYDHADVEAYSAGKKHIGSIDPKSLKLYKNAIQRRKLSNK